MTASYGYVIVGIMQWPKFAAFFYEVCSFVLGVGALLRWKVGSFFFWVQIPVLG